MLGKFIRPAWRKGHPKHREGGFSEPVVVLLKTDYIKSDRYKFGFRGDGWEDYEGKVVGWFFLPKGNYTVALTPWQRFFEWAASD